MNIETKVVRGYNSSSSGYSVEECLSFGWTHTESTTVRVGRGHRKEFILARDKNMPNYALLSRLETEYFDLKRTKKTYNPMEFSNVLLAFAAFIIPGIIYVTVKLNQKKKIEEHNFDIQKQMNAIVLKAKPLL